MTHRVFASALLVVLAAACGGDGKITEPRSVPRGTVLLAVGTDSTTGATIETNKDDYAPGEIVHLVGRGWAPNETVHLFMTEDPDTHDDVSADVTADSVGAFSVHFYDVQAHDIGVTFTLTATGATSGSSATVTFRDGAISLATIQMQDGAACTSSQGSVAAGTPICAHASFTISGSGATPAQIRWKSPAGAIVAISQRDPTFPNGTAGINTFDATFTPTLTGTWTVLLCESSNDNVAPGGLAQCPADTQRATQTFEVTPGSVNTTTSIVSDISPSVTGQPVTFTATVTGGSPVTTGNVTFKIGGTTCADAPTTIGTVALNGSGQATSPSHAFDATETGAVVRACYGGATGFNVSEGSTTQTVNKSPTTTTLSDSPPSSSFGQPVTFTATVTASGSGAGTPGGTVKLYELSGVETCAAPGSPIGTGTLSSGSAAIAVSTLGVGTHTITACYEGDLNYLPSSGTDSHNVTQIVTTTTITSLVNPTVTGQSTTFTATVKDAANAVVTSGTVTFKVGGASCSDAAATTFSGPTAVNGSGQVTTASQSYAASQSPKVIHACYSGTATFAASEGSLTQVINKGETTTTLSALPVSPSVFGQSVVFTATVTPDSPATGTPTGTVNFYDGGTCASPGTSLAGESLASGQAAVTRSTLAVGPHTIIACYGGSLDFEESSGSLAYTVNKAATTLALASNNNPSTFGDPVTFTATVSVTAPGAGTPTGTVNFAIGGTCYPATGLIAGGSPLGSAPLAAGEAAVTTSTLPAGTHTIVACYGGDGNFNGSGKTLSQVVNPKPTNTVATVETTTPQYSDKVKLKAVVTPHIVGTSELAGTVTFYVNGSVSCAAPPATSVGSDAIAAADDGVAELEYRIVDAAGTYTVTACFVSTNTNFANSGGTTPMTVAKEDGVVAPGSPYTNAVAVGPGVTASFTLAFTVREQNPEPDANAGAYPGDIDNTGLTVALVAVGSATNNTTVTCTPSAPIATLPAYADFKTYSCAFTGVAVDAYEVDADITGGYFVGGYADALTVYDPGAGFVTGGGKWVYPDASSDRVSFGLSFTFTGKGKTTPRGNLVVIRHLANGDVCRAKSNAIDAPAVVGKTASFTGKGNYGCVRPNGETYDGIGNQTILGWVEDNGEGSNATGPDKFWINMSAPGSKLLLGTPASTNARPLTGGNIQVPQPSSGR